MRKPKRFLTLVLVLLLINSIFFIAWYGFDLQGRVKDLAVKEISKALGGKAQIGELSIGERQLIAKDIVFAATDSSLAFNVQQLRVRYNLLKVIFSGFKMRKLLDDVEISSPIVNLRIRPKAGGEPRAHKKFEIPDLTPYFHKLKLTDGSISADIGIELTIINSDVLLLQEQLSNIEIQAVNDKQTNVNLNARSSSGGSIKAELSLDKGRLAFGEAEITNLNPSYAYHKDIKDFRTDLNLSVTASQTTANAPIKLQAKAFLWATEALFLDKYSLTIPYLAASGDENNIRAEISRLKLDNSTLNGYASITDLFGIPSLDAKLDFPSLDLSTLDPNLRGSFKGELVAQGPLSDPIAELRAYSESLAYQAYSLSAISLSAIYADKTLSANLLSAQWENQLVQAEAVYNLKTGLAKGSLTTNPLGTNGTDLIASGTVHYDLDLNSGLPMGELLIDEITFDYQGLHISDLSGLIKLIPGSSSLQQSYFIDATIHSTEGYSITVLGDLLSRNLLLDADFTEFNLADHYDLKLFQDLSPLVSGAIRAYLDRDQIVTRSTLNVDLSGSFQYNTDIRLIGAYNLRNGDAVLNLDSENGLFNGEPLDLSLTADLRDKLLNVYALRISDLVSLSGSMLTNSIKDFGFDLALNDLERADLAQFYPALELFLPQFSGLNLRASYNYHHSDLIDAKLSLNELIISGLYPLSAELSLSGVPALAQLDGAISNTKRELVSLSGELSIDDVAGLVASARIMNLSPVDVLTESPVTGTLNGLITASFKDLIHQIAQPELTVDLQANQINAFGLELDQVDLVASQKDELLQIDTVSARKQDLLALTGSGALGYNLLTNRYFENDSKLRLNLEGELFTWLDNNVDYILDARGRSRLDLVVGVSEDQFSLEEGNLTITGGSLKLVDQPEEIKQITLNSVIRDNRLIIQNFTANMGLGQLRINNRFTDDEGNRFQAGMLDLGVFEVSIAEPGIQGNIPYFTPPRSLSTVVLRGQNAPYATVMGPFDDMKITAQAVLSNASAVYPPNTENLLRLIYTFRDAAFKKNTPDPAPLPFSLDLLISLQDNINYVTYPTNLKIEPGSYLHIIYDGLTWRLVDASFSSEQGSIDIFGTVFNVDRLNIDILESQELMSIEGMFIKRAPDGTLVSLNVTTDRDNTKSLLERLEFNLSSDNPSDRSATEILSRLRYNQSVDELSSTQRQNLLSDEAISLISGNLNASLISPILYPVENSIRRFFKLDAFSINVGFIQNLATEFTNDPDNLANYTDMRQFSTDIVQFSSSILLNNLSLSLSKYLGSKFFLDYQLKLQEATDLQKNTVMLISHDTSLRLMLPYRLRLSYNLKYEATENTLSHGLMLQRSFRFRGL